MLDGLEGDTRIYCRDANEMLTILPESKTKAILLASRALYSCISRKRAIQYYYSYRAYCIGLTILITIVSDCRLQFCLFTNSAYGVCACVE